MRKKFDYLSIEVLILGIVGLALSGAILLDAEILEMYPSFGPDTIKLTRNLIIGMILYVLLKSVDIRKKQFRFVRPKFATEITAVRKVTLFGKTSTVNFITPFVQGFVVTIAIQMIAMALTSLPLFAVAEVSVYSFFILAAISEEFIFRIIIGEVCYKLLSLGKVNESLKIILSSAVSAILFAAIHTNYYSEIIILISVALGGFVFSWIMMKYNLELPVFLIHILNNVLAARGVVQTIQ